MYVEEMISISVQAKSGPYAICVGLAFPWPHEVQLFVGSRFGSSYIQVTALLSFANKCFDTGAQFIRVWSLLHSAYSMVRPRSWRTSCATSVLPGSGLSKEERQLLPKLFKLFRSGAFTSIL